MVENLNLVPILDDPYWGFNEILVSFESEIQELVIQSFSMIDNSNVLYESQSEFELGSSMIESPPSTKIQINQSNTIGKYP